MTNPATTQTKAPAPAKVAAPAATVPTATATAPAKPAFSFAGLSIQDAELPATRVTEADNELLPAFRDSFANKTAKGEGKWIGKGKSLTIPAEQVPNFERLVRQCAELLGCGSMIRLRTPQGAVVDVVSVGAVETKSETTGKMRKSGGTPTPRVGGKDYAGDVVAFFRAKSPRVTAKSK